MTDTQEPYTKAELEHKREIARLKLHIAGLQHDNKILKDKISELQAVLKNRVC